MATVTVNYAGVSTGTVVPIDGVGHAVNGYANEFPALPADVVAGDEPAEKLERLSARERLALVITQLAADAEAYRATEGHGTDRRADEIEAVAAGYQAELDAL